jgi:hypothetical protein
MNLKQRKRNWPLYYEITKPTRFDPGGLKTYWADEWEALQKSRQSAQTNDQPPNGPTPVNERPPDQPTQVNVEPAQVSAESAQADAMPITEPAGDLANTAAAIATVQLANATPNPADALAAEPRTEWCRAHPPDFARHSRRCAVCSHPDRDAIEGDFIRWRSPELIAKEYNLPGRFTIYRHVHSTGLYAWRKQELGRVLEGILESAEHVPLESSDVIIRAARIYAHLDDQGKWFEPPRTNFNFIGPAPTVYPLESVLPTNSARTRKRAAKNALPAGAGPPGKQKALAANRNIRQIKKSDKSLKAKEKANS